MKKCYRCNGPMSYEKFFGRDGSFWGWRCILCGEIFDEKVLKNRKRMREKY